MVEPLEGPVGVFLTIMTVILITPLLSKRVRLPGIVGLILGGMLVGPHGLHLLAADRTIELLSTVGLIYLMFNAGLEIDLQQFRSVRHRALIFGTLTFSIPLLSSIPVGRWLGLSMAGAVLLGAVYASHTLVAFPILSRLGIVHNEAASVTIGATVFTDVASLLVLAVIAGTQSSNISTASVILQIMLMIGYAVFVIMGLPLIGKLFFRHFTSRAIEFQFVLVALFVSALLAERIGMHAIVGAFLAGLAINSTLPSRSAVIGQVLFMGETFFIPIFLISIGMAIDPLAVVVSRETLLAGITVTIAVYTTKFIAAWISARIFHYSRDELLTMWGLSQAQAAATLAIILVGVDINLFPAAVFNGAILMVLFTSITSPLLVQHFGSRLEPSEMQAEKKNLFNRIIVPIEDPRSQEYLITLASILIPKEGTLLPLRMVQEFNGRALGLDNERQILEGVREILKESGIQIKQLLRIDASVSIGILRAATENDASLIVMNWKSMPMFRLRTALDEVIWDTTVPVLVGRMNIPVNAIKRVVMVVPYKSIKIGHAYATLEMVAIIARAINVPLLVLSAGRYEAILREELKKLKFEQPYEIARLGDDVVPDVIGRVAAQDLVVVTTIGPQTRFRSSLGYIPEQLAAAISGSLVVVYYP